MVSVGHVEELQFAGRLADRLLDHLHGVRALDLEAIGLALAVGAQSRALVEFDLHVVLAGRGVEHHPVQRRRAADQIELVRGEIEQDDVADHVAFGRDRHELLGLVRLEALVAVHRQIREQLQRIRSFDREIGHVIGLVEQHAGVLPGLLLVAPVGVFGRHARIDVRSGLLIAQQLDRILHGVAARLPDSWQPSTSPLGGAMRGLLSRTRRYAPVYNFPGLQWSKSKANATALLWANAHLRMAASAMARRWLGCARGRASARARRDFAHAMPQAVRPMSAAFVRAEHHQRLEHVTAIAAIPEMTNLTLVHRLGPGRRAQLRSALRARQGTEGRQAHDRGRRVIEVAVMASSRFSRCY